MEVDLQVSPDLWDELTDLSVTVYDSTGQQVRGGNAPVNYAFGRMTLALSDSTTGVPLTVEFYPAFARLPAHAWKGNVQVRVDVSREQIAALERLGLFDPDAPALQWAVERYLDTARHVAGVGDALYPEAEGWAA